MSQRINRWFRMISVSDKDAYLAVITTLPSGDYRAEIGVLNVSSTGGSIEEACKNLESRINPGGRI